MVRIWGRAIGLALTPNPTHRWLHMVSHRNVLPHRAVGGRSMRSNPCQRLSHSMEGLMCGAFPALRNCSADDEALQRMDAGCGPTAGNQWNAAMRYSKPLAELLGREPKPDCTRSAGCYTEALDPKRGRVWCPQGLLKGWPVSPKHSSS